MLTNRHLFVPQSSLVVCQHLCCVFQYSLAVGIKAEQFYNAWHVSIIFIVGVVRIAAIATGSGRPFRFMGGLLLRMGKATRGCIGRNSGVNRWSCTSPIDGRCWHNRTCIIHSGRWWNPTTVWFTGSAGSILRSILSQVHSKTSKIAPISFLLFSLGLVVLVVEASCSYGWLEVEWLSDGR